MPERTFMAELPDGIPTPSVDTLLTVRVPRMIAGAWYDVAADNVDSGAYLRALENEDNFQYPYLGDRDAAAVVVPLEYASYLEQGRAGFHLPSHWGMRGGKWKEGANGRYARVPFRHDTPISESGGSTTGRERRAMPTQLYNGRTARFWGKGRVPYTVSPGFAGIPGGLGIADAPSVVRPNSAALGLERGDRMMGFGDYYRLSRSYDLYRTPSYFEGVGIEADAGDVPEAQSYTWRASKYEGMTFVGNHGSPGGGSQGEYMTWRTITEDSEGWYIPPTIAHHFADRALGNAAPEIQRLLDEAVAADVTAALLDATAPLGG